MGSAMAIRGALGYSHWSCADSAGQESSLGGVDHKAGPERNAGARSKRAGLPEGQQIVMAKKAGWTIRKTSPTSPTQKRQAHSTPSPPRAESGGWRGLFGVVIGMLSGSISWLLPDGVPLFVKVCLTLFFLGSALACAADRRVVRRLSAAGAVLSLATLAVVSLVTVPSDSQRAAAELFKETESANIWVGRDPVMFKGSEQYVTDNFEALYSQDNRWTVPALDSAATVFDLVQDGAAFEGESVLLTGQVIATQHWDNGEQILQLSALTKANASLPSVREAVSERWPRESDVDHLLAFTRPDPPEPAVYAIYCRTHSDLMTSLTEGDVVIARGVLLAYGRTMHQGGGFTDVAYLACNVWDRIVDAG